MVSLVLTKNRGSGNNSPKKLKGKALLFSFILSFSTVNCQLLANTFSRVLLKSISDVVKDLTDKLNKVGVSSKFDDRVTKRPGEKFAQHEIQGVPVRITIGPKDLEKNSLEIFRRDTLEKQFIQINDSIDFVLINLTTLAYDLAIYLNNKKHRQFEILRYKQWAFLVMHQLEDNFREVEGNNNNNLYTVFRNFFSNG